MDHNNSDRVSWIEIYGYEIKINKNTNNNIQHKIYYNKRLT